MHLSTTTSSISMPDASMPPDDSILAELDALENEFPDTAGAGELTALVRLIRQDANRAKMFEKIKLAGWLLLPLRKDKFPALNQLKEHVDHLTRLQAQDALTGLANRRGFDQALDLEVQRATRFKTPLSLCLLDIDDFKSINDTHGHPCGDKVIQTLGLILKTEIRMIDIAARVGGEEFALLLPGTGLTRAQKLLTRILEMIRSTAVHCGDVELRFSASMGVASYRGKEIPDPGKLMTEADKALYRAKRAGKNRIECAPLLDLGQSLEQTLVQQNEKRFLFS